MFVIDLDAYTKFVDVFIDPSLPTFLREGLNFTQGSFRFMNKLESPLNNPYVVRG